MLIHTGFSLRKPLALGLLFLPLCFVQGCQSAPKETSEVVTVAATDEEMALLNQGDIARSLGKYDEAMQHYQAAAEMSKGAIRAHLELADMYQRAGRGQDERAILATAHALAPHSPQVAHAYGRSLLAAGDTQKALNVAADGLKSSPSDMRLLNLQGIALDSSGKHQDAQSLYRKALEAATVETEQAATVNNLALSLVASGHADEAIDLIEQQPASLQSDIQMRQLLALAYGVNGEKDKAYELGLRDLSLREVNENLRFYEQFRMGNIDPVTLFMPSGS